MKRLLLPFFLLLSFSLFAQPVNDDCDGLIDLGTIPFCPDSVWYTNVDATESNIGPDNLPTGCDGGNFTEVGGDVWFQFTTNDTLIDIQVTVTGLADPNGSTPMSNPQVAVYRGECLFDELSLLKCGRADDGENIISIDVIGLDPNTTYFIRVSDWSTTTDPNWGSFQLCIDEQDPEFTLCEDGNSIECTGVLYDCGGPDGDYTNNEDGTFTICPPAPNDVCITFNLQYFNIEDGADVLTFYDGPDTSSPIIDNISGFGGVSGGGGVCFQVQASSGCLTVGFTSNGVVNFEGFCGAWECSSSPCEGPAPIDVDSDPTNEELATFVTTPQTQATITNVDCAQGAYGTFIGTGTDLGLAKGIVLTSGSIANSVGPNVSGSISQINNTPGDPNLDTLSYLAEGEFFPESNDACIIELDVFVATDELSFEYIFGSDEYTEWVNSTFNDIFALLVSGPGITGLASLDNQENVAIIPGTNDPVEINSVNNNLNWEYYRNNEVGQSVEYDGLTSDYLAFKKSLTASIPVIPCTTYHLKFAISDRGDFSLDSGVFIGELKGDVPNLTINFASGVDYFVEDCTGTEDQLLITLENPQPDSQVYDVVIGGTATLGVDYTLSIPSQITLAPGVTQLEFPIVPLTDGVTEGIETVTITLTNNFGCGNVEVNTIEVEIHDQPLVEIFAGADTAFVCEGDCLPMEVTGGVDYEWVSTFPGVFDDPTSPTPNACPGQSQWVSVTGSITQALGCNDVDSVFLMIIDPMVSIVANSDTDICVGESVSLSAVDNVNGTGLQWSPPDFLDDPFSPNPIATPPFTTTYQVTVDVAGCTASDFVTISVDPYDPPTLTTTDTLLCQGSVLQLADSMPIFLTTNYIWSPDDYIITDLDIAGAVAVPQDDITYTLISSSQNNFCADTFTVNVEVLPAQIDIENGDYLELCLGDSVLLTTLNSTNGVGITWTPDLFLDTLEGGQVWATPTETVQYFVTLVVGGCTVMDSITIRVDSLPDLSIFPAPGDNPFCMGEVINLITENYFPGDYPEIEHLWTASIGENSDLDNLNLNITTTQTFTYTRVTTNNACMDTAEIEIIVVDPSSIAITPQDTIICEGNEVQLTAFNPDTDEFTWSPPETLSCEECPDPVATPSGTTQYVVEAMVSDCPVAASVTINVVEEPDFSFASPPQICLGESITLNTQQDDNPATTYSWSTDPPGPFASNVWNPTVSPTQTTTYMLTIDNGICPAMTDQVTVEVVEQTTMSISEDAIICVDESIELTATANNSGTFTWSTGDIDEFATSSTITVSPGTDNLYEVVFINNCDTVVQSVLVSVENPYNVEIGLEPDMVTEGYFEGEEVVLTAMTDSPNPQGDTYTWHENGNPAGINSEITIQPVNNPTSIDLIVTSENGCEYPAFISFNVIPAIANAPNAFTPDGDGINDYFNVLTRGTLLIKTFQVFDRWGEKVYDNDNPGTGWDGTHNGEPMPSDVYVYIIVVETLAQRELEAMKGDVTLIR